MTPKKELPVYQLDVSLEDENSGVQVVALVKNPAIDGIGGGSGLFLAFNEAKEFAFKVTDEEKQIVSGPLMIPDRPIYRKDDDGKEYYVQFSKDAIYKANLKLFKNQYTANVNMMHQATEMVENVYMFESFLIDRNRMTPPKGWEDLPDGAWFVSYKVDNKPVWGEVKDGTFRGFSVEGMFLPTDIEESALIAQIKGILEA